MVASPLLGVPNRSVMNGWICGAVCLYWEVVPFNDNNVLCKGVWGKLTKIELVRLLCQGKPSAGSGLLAVELTITLA